MKKLLLALLSFTLLFTKDATGQTDTVRAAKTIFSIGADLVPIAFVAGSTDFAIGSSLGLEIPSSPKTSLVVNAGYILYSNHPGTYGGHPGDLEYVPVSFSLRKQTKGSFYFGPKAGFNIDVETPYDAPLNYNKFNFHGGFSFGISSKQKRFHPDFSLLYHSTVHGSMISFQSSLRFRIFCNRR